MFPVAVAREALGPVAWAFLALDDAVAGFAYSALGARHGHPPEGVPLEPGG